MYFIKGSFRGAAIYWTGRLWSARADDALLYPSEGDARSTMTVLEARAYEPGDLLLATVQDGSAARHRGDRCWRGGEA